MGAKKIVLDHVRVGTALEAQMKQQPNVSKFAMTEY